MMDSDVRVLPFTEEEKARLNEKVRKMKFSRPPPKLPVARSAAQISAPSSLRTSRVSGSTEGEKNEGNSSVDDSGISSCGSEKCPTPAPQSSPFGSIDDVAQCSSVLERKTEPYDVACDKYVCDGDDWVQDDSAVVLKSDLEIDISAVAFQEDYVKASTSSATLVVAKKEDDGKFCSSGGLDLDASNYALLSVDVSQLGAVEKIDATSPVVYSERLEATLTRKRVELMESSPLPQSPIGKFEEPKYGPVLLSRTFPTNSLQQIMSSALQNLEGYRVLGRPRICQAGGKPPPEPSLIADIEAELRKETIEIRPPTATVLKRKRKKGMSKKPEQCVPSTQTDIAKPPKIVKVEAPEEMSSETPRKECVEKHVPKSAGEPPIKMIFRKDADRKISAVRLEIPDLTSPRAEASDSKALIPCVSNDPQSKSYNSLSSSATTVEVVDARNDSSSGGLKIRIKLHAPTAGATEASVQRKREPQPIVAAKKTPALEKKESATLVVNAVRDKKASAVANNDDDIIIVHEHIRKPSQQVKVNPRPWAQLNVMEQSYVAKLAALLKVSEVDITRKDWFDEICGKVEKTVYHLDLDISTLKGSRVNYRKRVEHVRFIRDQLRLLLAERRCRAEFYKSGGAIAPKRPQRRCVPGPSKGPATITRTSAVGCGMPMQPQVKRQPLALDRRKKLDKIVERLRPPLEVVPKDPMPSSQANLMASVRLGVPQRATQMRKESTQERFAGRSFGNVSTPEDLRFYPFRGLKAPAMGRLRGVDLTRCTTGIESPEIIFRNGVAFERRHDVLSGSHVPMFNQKVAAAALTVGNE